MRHYSNSDKETEMDTSQNIAVFLSLELNNINIKFSLFCNEIM